jgi:hypothetical protein
MHYSIALTISALMSSAAPAAPPSAAAPDHWTPLAFSIFNTCTGEEVYVAGNAHVTTRTWTEGNLVFVRGHINMNLSGVGLLSGRRYHLQQNSNSSLVQDVTTGASATDQVFHLSLNSGGSMPNARVTMNGTVVLDAVGNSTVIPKRWDTTCK